MSMTDLVSLLDTLSAQRVELTALPDTLIAAIVYHLSPDDAARTQAIVREFRDRETQLKGEIAETEAAVRAAVLETGASAFGTHLQATTVARRHATLPGLRLSFVTHLRYKGPDRLFPFPYRLLHAASA